MKSDLLTIEDDAHDAKNFAKNTNDYNELLSPDQENLTIAPNLPSPSNSTDAKKVLH